MASWGNATYVRVDASAGREGAGGGAPVEPLAPELREPTVAPAGGLAPAPARPVVKWPTVLGAPAGRPTTAPACAPTIKTTCARPATAGKSAKRRTTRVAPSPISAPLFGGEVGRLVRTLLVAEPHEPGRRICGTYQDESGHGGLHRWHLMVLDSSSFIVELEVRSTTA